MNTLHIKTLRKAVDILGGQSCLARRLSEVTGQSYQQGHISAWLRRHKKIPAQVAIPIERLTNGLVTRYDLRPDVFGDSPNTMHHKSQGQLLSEGERA